MIRPVPVALAGYPRALWPLATSLPGHRPEHDEPDDDEAERNATAEASEPGARRSWRHGGQKR